MPPYKVLIVDDDPAVVRMLQRIVSDYELGEVVGRAADGPDGESAALQLRPDIVLIDLLMPRQDGLETVRRLREQGFSGSFIMISQVSDKDLVARAYKHDVEFFIYKPLNLTEILSVVRRVTEGLQMRQTLQNIRASLAPLGVTVALPPTPVRVAAGAAGAGPGLEQQQVRTAARRVLADLGILGEAGASDLVAIALLPQFRGSHAGADFDLGTVYTALSEYYQHQSGEGKAPGVKAIEQRLRSGAGAPGRINVKKFIDAFLHELESSLHEQGLD